MKLKPKSIRPFIGAKDYKLSREFYRDLGFEEFVISHNMSVFRTGDFAFYLQDYYAKDWIDNTMVFLEVDNVHHHLKHLKKSGIVEKYKNTKCSEIIYNDWGNEFFLHDPSGILWHFGEFNT
ncbi:VOC family protein [Winogradskyella psychrotolerans]|uniref:VOC family protein n=1 Tax=Winogradskyella psychrotolerans TaxID=1344585 RepID=UPI001C065E93|nr:VOC family protein [Winogradskyella psychrotolerans]MBU2929784.1 glyoxalase [Winogradskyella psychrotolerans]